eukprot:6468133-Amphidinium_carterae.2
MQITRTLTQSVLGVASAAYWPGRVAAGLVRLMTYPSIVRGRWGLAGRWPALLLEATFPTFGARFGGSATVLDEAERWPDFSMDWV